MKTVSTVRGTRRGRDVPPFNSHSHAPRQRSKSCPDDQRVAGCSWDGNKATQSRSESQQRWGAAATRSPHATYKYRHQSRNEAVAPTPECARCGKPLTGSGDGARTPAASVTPEPRLRCAARFTRRLSGGTLSQPMIRSELPCMVIQARPIKIVVVLAVVSAQLALCSYSDAHNMGVHPLRHAIKRNWRHHPLRRASLAHTAIIGGTAAEEGTFPSLAHIQDFRGEEVGDCTGTVVAPNLILTAGHCAENVETGIVNEPSGYIVITGNLDWMAPEHQVSAVSRVIVYPGFVRSVLDRDAALLVLSAPTIAPAIPLAAWPSDSSKLQPGTAALLAGWGKTYYEQEVPTERLQWAETAVQGPGWCEKNASSFYAASELCTIDPPNYTTGTCEGDSGGPLIANAPSGGIIEIGIISTGYE